MMRYYVYHAAIQLSIYLLVLIYGCQVQVDKHQSKSTETTKIALLGTIHLAGTGDIGAPNVKNVLGEKRQAEIDSLLSSVARFNPNKVLVEMVNQKQDSLMENYQAYLKDQFELTASEIDQLGMKLAKRMGHDSIYAADHMMSLPFERLMNFAQNNRMKTRLDSFISHIKQWATKETEYIKSHSLLDYYNKLNSEEETRMNRNIYLDEMMKYTRDSLYPGPDVSAQWYKRNLYILANMDRIIEEGDRALFIVGNGHKALLEGFIRSRKDWEYVEIRDYLK